CGTATCCSMAQGRSKGKKIIPLFRSSKKHKPSLAMTQTGAQLFRQLVAYVRNRARERHLGLSLIPALVTLRIVASENLRAIRAAFEEGIFSERPVHPELLADFLEMRRHFTAAVVFKAAENWRGSFLQKKIFARLQELLDEMQFLSENRNWDWVSFHEAEFEFFLQVANLSGFNTARFVLNRIRRDYLDSVLSYNKNFWNMENAVSVYREVLQLIRNNKADAAEQRLLEFFTQNDKAILDYYKSQINFRGLMPNEPPQERVVYGSATAQLSDWEIEEAVRRALAEDRADADITTQAIFKDQGPARGRIFVKSPCVLCGVRLAEFALRYFDSTMQIELAAADGDTLRSGDTVLHFHGDVRAVLQAERVALNFLAFLSAIATHTRRVATVAAQYGIKVLDTRKTIPGLRNLSKYAVIKGGGCNHRFNLAEMGLIKDNHIAHAGSVSAAIEAFRRQAPFTPLEVEVENLEQLREALALKPDMILLDNMEPALMKKAVRLIREANRKFGTRITAEASGGFHLRNLHRLKGTGVDFVSLGSITNTITPPDFSLEIENVNGLPRR
ncbi:MAG: carboxylating nicotinate-nucleotide diphosphorylase, partial [Turneriella sp.]|nr:carboxylating nicotinate-nucleotide diphosphorylase [Turneriella sp.]